MKYPKIRVCHQIYKLGSEEAIYIGRGMEKVIIESPDSSFEEFLIQVNGKNSIDFLEKKYAKAKEWIDKLEKAGVIEWNNLDEEIINETHEMNRYSRQIFHFCLYNNSVKKSIESQKKLQSTKIAVLGVGAGGTTLLRHLNAIGFGNIHIVDFDDVVESNLSTHSNIDEWCIGTPKIEVMEKILKRQNRSLNLSIKKDKFNSHKDIVDHIKDCDFVFQAFDKPMGKSLEMLNLACIELEKPYASIGQTDKSGRVGYISIPGVTPCAQCLGITEIHTIKEHLAAPLTGPIVSVLSGILVHEVAKFITGYSDTVLLKNSLVIDTETWNIHHVSHELDTQCKVCRHLQI